MESLTLLLNTYHIIIDVYHLTKCHFNKTIVMSAREEEKKKKRRLFAKTFPLDKVQINKSAFSLSNIVSF